MEQILTLRHTHSQQDQPSKIIILGPPCSGKTTVQRILIERFGFAKMQLPEQSPQKSPLTLKFTSQNKGSERPKSPEQLSPKIDMKKYGGMSDLCLQGFSQRGVFVLKNYSSKALKHLKQRNFINMIWVDAPFLIRYRHAKKKWNKIKGDQGNNDFVVEDENQQYGVEELKMEEFAKIDMEAQTDQYHKCLQYARVKLINSTTISDLISQIYKSQPSIIRRYRPSWNQYFMKLADIARRRSNCMKSTVGAVIVSDQNRVISTGYNGTPRGLVSCFRGGCRRCNNNQSKGLDNCLCLHGQESAIIEVGIQKTKGCRLYTTLFPCFSCAKIIKQAGIKKIFYMDPYNKEDSGQKFLSQNYSKEDVVCVPIDNLYY